MTPLPLLAMLTISTDEPVVGSKPILAFGSGMTICGEPMIFVRSEASGAADESMWNGCDVGMSILEYGKTKLFRLSELRIDWLLRSGRLIGCDVHNCLPSTTGGLLAQPNTSSW